MKLSKGDVAELTIFIAVAGFLGYLSVESALTTPMWGIALLSVTGVATVVLQRTAPSAAAVLALALLMLSAAIGTGAETVLVISALLRAGISGSARRAWTLFSISTVVGCAATLILVWRVRSGPPLLGLAPRADLDAWPAEWLSIWVTFVGAALIATLIGVNAGHRRRAISALVDRAEQMQRERDQQADITRGLERERISREMHDVIAHSLSVMIALADGAQATAPQSLEKSQRAVGNIAETGRRTLSEVRRLLARVNDEDVQDASMPLLDIEQLPALVNEFVAAGLPVRLERTGTLREDSAVGLTIYRIAQESLTNVLRHAREVKEVIVRLDLGEDEIAILVEDISAPPSSSGSPGRGLIGIRERAALYDGDVQAGARDGGGWRVCVRLQTEE